MPGPRRKPLVWGGWPPATRDPGPASQYFEYGGNGEDPVPAGETAAEQAQTATPEKAHITAEEAEAASVQKPVSSPEDPAAAAGDQAETGAAEAMQAPVEPAVSQEDEQSAEMARPRPPANPTGPYYPPGPPTGPYIPPEPPGYPPTAGWELARAYVPIQRFGTTYSPAEALEKGTLFPELWRPYQGR